MNFLKNILKKKEEKIESYEDFWNWFQKNERAFFDVVKNKKDIEELFFNKLSPKLGELKEGYFYLTGMCDDNTVELDLTADGNVSNLVFVEELVNAAPIIDGWKFTAHKPALDIENVSISMYEYEFNGKNMSFYSNELDGYPDEIDIVIVHDDLTEENKKKISTGTHIFLDNYLGELDFVNNIDNIKVIGKQEAEKGLIPMSKLKDFLIWRQKEFIEKYDGTLYNTEEDEYSILEFELKNGNALIAVIDNELLQWEAKASHPWVSYFTIKYNGSDNKGMPNKNDIKLLDKIEEAMLVELKDFDGNLYIGRETGNNEREIYFASKDFRKISKVFYETKKIYSSSFEIEYDIYKDKYWKSFERFQES